MMARYSDMIHFSAPVCLAFLAAWREALGFVFRRLLAKPPRTPSTGRARITIRRDMSRKLEKLPPLHPGEHLKTVFEDAGLSANAIALAIGIRPNWLLEIINGKRSISSDTALCLSRYFGTSAQMWVNLQSKYEIDKTS